ncbi:MAG: TonB family protein [bacterium]|nr:TonB family protein [bacterium]
MWSRRDEWLLIGFVMVSLLLHLLAASRLSLRFLTQVPEVESKPIVVEMLPQEKPRERPPKELELDVPPPPVPEQRTTPAKRLAEHDHQVKKEIAPKGKDFEDRKASRKTAPVVKAVPLVPKPAPVPAPPPAPARPSAPARPLVPEGKNGPKVASRPARPLPAPPSGRIPLDSLMKLPQATLDREARSKKREGVGEGDVVWLDTEKDLLASFFRRFRDGIYMAWVYPSSSIHRGEQGNCRLQVIVDRQGVVKKTEVLRASGFPALDNAAVAAVRKASPYGPLPSSYKEQILRIVVDFHYVLNRDKPLIRRWGYRQVI